MPLDIGPSYEAYESLSITNAAAVSLTSGTYTVGPTGSAATLPQALITVESNPIRFRVDGTAPTTSEGHLVQAGSKILLDSADQVSKFQAIATGAAATIRVSYGR